VEASIGASCARHQRCPRRRDGAWRRRASRVARADCQSDFADATSEFRVLLGEGLGQEAPALYRRRNAYAQRLREELSAARPEEEQPSGMDVNRLRFDLEFLTRLDGLAGAPPPESAYMDVAVELLTGEAAAIGAAEWDKLVSHEDSVFLEHGFLAGLEETGCVSLSKGWQPRFLVVRERVSGRLVGASPMYLKAHSGGEFIEERDWIRASLHYNVSHWPRLFVGVPFTPHCGSRLLVARFLPPEKRAAITQSLLRAMVTIAERAKLSVNVAFCESIEEAELFSGAGFVERLARQAWWKNRRPVPYSSFDDFLGTMRVKNANMISRQRRQLANESCVVVEVVDGKLHPDAVTEELMCQVFTNCYFPTQLRNGNVMASSAQDFYADLNMQFFQYLASTFSNRLLLVVAKQPETEDSASRVVGGALCFAKGRRICGRYWGYPLDMPSVGYLHFECCYYALIEHAVRHGYERIEPGNGGGDVFKVQRARGFEPAITRSHHFIPHTEVRSEIAELAAAVVKHRPSWIADKYSAYAPVRGKRKPKS